MVYGVIPGIVARGAPIIVGYVARGLNYQSRAISGLYSRPFLPQNFRREAVRGIQHGLYAGGGYEIAKDFITMGVETGSAPFSQSPTSKTGTFYKTRRRSTTRTRCRCPTKFQSNYSRRRSSYRRY